MRRERMDNSRIARTVAASDLAAPDGSSVMYSLRNAAAMLAVIDGLNCGSLDLDYSSSVWEPLGMSREDVEAALRRTAIATASREIVEARQSLHDLLAEVQLKPKAAV